MWDHVIAGAQDNVFGGPYPAKNDELIVSLRYLNLISRKFDDLNLPRPWMKRRSDKLNLALLQLGNPTATAIGVGTAAAHLPTWAKSRRPDPGNDRPLDRVLWGLRQLFSYDNGGWTPPLGKNRFLGSVHGVGEVQHVGGGLPMRLAQGINPPARSAQPGSNVRVGVLDGGFYPHEWLAGGYSAEAWDLLPDQPTPGLMEGHATFVTGLILSQAPGARVDVRQVLDSEGKAESWPVAEALVDLGRSGVNVLNLSFACFTEDGEPPLVLAAAMDRLDPDIAVIAAAGNHGQVVPSDDELETRCSGKPTLRHRARTKTRPQSQQNLKPAWPAALDNVIAVGAAEPPEQGSVKRAAFSPNAPWVDLYAPGVNVRSTYLPTAGPQNHVQNFDRWAQWSGTSFAAALVSGAVAAATEPGRISAATAAQTLVARLNQGPALTVDGTAAKYVSLRLL